jgi:hypothetical protein
MGVVLKKKKRTITDKGKDVNVMKGWTRSGKKKSVEALPHKERGLKGSDGRKIPYSQLRRGGSSYETNVYWDKSSHKNKRSTNVVREMTPEERRKHKYGGFTPKVKDARERVKLGGIKYSSGKKRTSNFSRKRKK